jgi:hypothetical protein
VPTLDDVILRTATLRSTMSSDDGVKGKVTVSRADVA